MLLIVYNYTECALLQYIYVILIRPNKSRIVLQLQHTNFKRMRRKCLKRWKHLNGENEHNLRFSIVRGQIHCHKHHNMSIPIYLDSYWKTTSPWLFWPISRHCHKSRLESQRSVYLSGVVNTYPYHSIT